jgi:hypothetical protein
MFPLKSTEQRQPKVRVIMRDLHDQTQIRTNHQGASFLVAALNLAASSISCWGEQRKLPDLSQVTLYSCITIFSSHRTFFHERAPGAGYAFSDSSRVEGVP